MERPFYELTPEQIKRTIGKGTISFICSDNLDILELGYNVGDVPYDINKPIYYEEAGEDIVVRNQILSGFNQFLNLFDKRYIFINCIILTDKITSGMRHGMLTSGYSFFKDIEICQQIYKNENMNDTTKYHLLNCGVYGQVLKGIPELHDNHIRKAIKYEPKFEPFKYYRDMNWLIYKIVLN